MKKQTKKEADGKESKAKNLLIVSTSIEELENQISLLKIEETALKEGILVDLKKEQIRAFSVYGYDFSVSKSEVVVVKNEKSVMDYLKKKHPEAIRESIDKAILSHYVKGENEKIPGAILEARSYLRFKKYV